MRASCPAKAPSSPKWRSADDLQPVVAERHHHPLEVRVGLAAGAPDDPQAVALERLPLMGQPRVDEVVGDDHVGPVEDVLVDVRLGPVDPRTGLAALLALLLARGHEVGMVRRVGEGGANALP
jgi:hypothetical protein